MNYGRRWRDLFSLHPFDLAAQRRTVGFVNWLNAGFGDLPGPLPKRERVPIKLGLTAPRPDRCKPARNSLRFCNLRLHPVDQGIKATQRLDGHMQLLHLRQQTA